MRALPQRRFRVCLHLPFRRDLAHDFGDALAEIDSAPLGIILRRVIRRHVLCPVARQGAGEPVLAGEIVAAIMQVQTQAVPRQRDIAGMGVHARRRKNMRAIHGHALRLMDGRGVAVVDVVTHR